MAHRPGTGLIPLLYRSIARVWVKSLATRQSGRVHLSRGRGPATEVADPSLTSHPQMLGDQTAAPKSCRWLSLRAVYGPHHSIGAASLQVGYRVD